MSVCVCQDFFPYRRSVLLYWSYLLAVWNFGNMSFWFKYECNIDATIFFYIAHISQLVANLTSKTYSDSIRKLITDDSTHDYHYYGPSFYTPKTSGTSHLSVVDHHGNAVSVTSTINGRWALWILFSRFPILCCPRITESLWGWPMN